MKVKEVSPRVLRDYEGMNYETAHKIGMPYPYGKNTVIVDATMSEHRKKQVAEHERFEMMLERHHPSMPYWDAHKAALKAQKRI
jgi:hypothetical protein